MDGDIDLGCYEGSASMYLIVSDYAYPRFFIGPTTIVDHVPA